MTRDERVNALLSRGYLPKELPPPFTSESFAGQIAAVDQRWRAHEAGLGAQQRRSYPPVSSYARFDMARKGHSRRILGVPNPVNQYYLVSAIADHQDEFEAISDRSPISLTSAHISIAGKRSVSMPSLSILSESRVKAYSTSRAILQTDILSFYHAIYTHSVPWALHGKKAAKRNRNPANLAFYGNKIDALLRSCQDGQTIGIPVGPDTSRIISEIILCAVESLVGRGPFTGLVGGYRYMDDFFLCFDTHVAAEEFLASLREAVLCFDLQLNASKTRIIDALSFNEEIWPSDIAQMSFGRSPSEQRRSLLKFFTEVVRYAKSLPDESISSFAVRKTTRILVHYDNWDIYESFLIRIARENSNCLDSVVKILCTYAAAGYPISERVGKFAEIMIEEHASYNHHYEVVWTLWLCRSLSIRLGARATQLVAKIENSLCACLVLLLRSRTLLTGRGAVSDWMGTVTADDLKGEHWMLIYEAGIRKSWTLPGAAAAVANDPHFSVLRDHGVSFFDTRAGNVALDIPSISQLLDGNLAERRSAILPGAIYVEARIPRGQRPYERLGEDYGGDDVDWHRFGGDWGDLPDDDKELF